MKSCLAFHPLCVFLFKIKIFDLIVRLLDVLVIPVSISSKFTTQEGLAKNIFV